MWRRLALDFFFPPRCGGCRARGGWFCDRCRASLRAAPRHACPACARHTSVWPCPLCFEEGPGLDALTAAVVLSGPVREAVHRMKYRDRPQVGLALAPLCAGLPGLAANSVLVPVPLGRRRRRERGYNQAEVLARELGVATGLACLDALERAGDTPPQVGRGGDDRRQALRGAFSWTASAPPLAVVLVDDVVTTGATLMECGRACREAGVARVTGVALAIG